MQRCKPGPTTSVGGGWREALGRRASAQALVLAASQYIGQPLPHRPPPPGRTAAVPLPRQRPLPSEPPKAHVPKPTAAHAAMRRHALPCNCCVRLHASGRAAHGRAWPRMAQQHRCPAASRRAQQGVCGHSKPISPHALLQLVAAAEPACWPWPAAAAMPEARLQRRQAQWRHPLQHKPRMHVLHRMPTHTHTHTHTRTHTHTHQCHQLWEPPTHPPAARQTRRHPPPPPDRRCRRSRGRPSTPGGRRPSGYPPALSKAWGARPLGARPTAPGSWARPSAPTGPAPPAARRPPRRCRRLCGGGPSWLKGRHAAAAPALAPGTPRAIRAADASALCAPAGPPPKGQQQGALVCVICEQIFYTGTAVSPPPIQRGTISRRAGTLNASCDVTGAYIHAVCPTPAMHTRLLMTRHSAAARRRCRRVQHARRFATVRSARERTGVAGPSQPREGCGTTHHRVPLLTWWTRMVVNSGSANTGSCNCGLGCNTL